MSDLGRDTSGLDARDLNYSMRRYYVDRFLSRQVSQLEKNALALDLGGNRIKKRGNFNIDDYGLDVIYADLMLTKQPDVQTDAMQMAFADNTFDVVICSEVLEHLYDPRKAVGEIYRVLKDGGVFLATIPFLFRIHADPYDYGRYTDYFWNELLTKAELEAIGIEKQGAMWSVMADTMRGWVVAEESAGGPGGFKRDIWKRFTIWFRGKALGWDQAALLDDQSSYLKSYTTGFGLVAKKPDANE